MLIVEPGYITKFFHLWNIKKDRKALVKEVENLINQGELLVKYFKKEKMIGITIGKKTSNDFRLFDPNEK
jgi:hypothetical protein